MEILDLIPLGLFNFIMRLLGTLALFFIYLFFYVIIIDSWKREDERVTSILFSIILIFILYYQILLYDGDSLNLY